MFEHEELISYKTFTEDFEGVYKGLAAVTRAAKEKDEDKQITELVKIRASQLNGCAFCVKVHVGIAKQVGVEQPKIDMLTVWRDTSIFSEKEKIALALTEDLTKINANNPNEALMAAAKEHFSKDQLVLLIINISAINAWNRLGVGLGFDA